MVGSRRQVEELVLGLDRLLQPRVHQQQRQVAVQTVHPHDADLRPHVAARFLGLVHVRRVRVVALGEQLVLRVLLRAAPAFLLHLERLLPERLLLLRFFLHWLLRLGVLLRLRVVLLVLVDLLDLNDFPAPVPARVGAPEALVEPLEEVDLLDELPDGLPLGFCEGACVVEVELEDVVLDVCVAGCVPRAMFSCGVRCWWVFL